MALRDQQDITLIKAVARAFGRGQHPQRQEDRLVRHQLPTPLRVPLLPKQTPTDFVPPRHLGQRHARLLQLRQEVVSRVVV